MRLTEHWIKDQIYDIHEAAADGDDELAHALEDKLHMRVLRYVSNGGRNARRFARMARDTEKIDFTRRCT